MSNRLRAGAPWGLCLAGVLSLGGCESEKAEATAESAPSVGLLELPISHRHTDQEPASATRVEVGPQAIVVGGETAVELDNAKIPPGEQQGMLIPKLQGKLSSRAITLVVHGATPYATLARVMATAQKGGVKEFYFQVRKPAATTETGWMRLSHVQFTDTTKPPIFEASEMPEWSVFTDAWGDVYAGCREDPAGDCGYVPSNKAEGGKLDLLIRNHGTGISARFRQYLPDGEEAPEEKKKAGGPAMLDGIAAPVAAEEEEIDPSTEASYTLRADQAARPDSPFSSIVKPVCGDTACAAVVDVQGISMVARVVSVIGAAFPDGTPEPKLAFLNPPE